MDIREGICNDYCVSNPLIRCSITRVLCVSYTRVCTTGCRVDLDLYVCVGIYMCLGGHLVHHGALAVDIRCVYIHLAWAVDF